MSDLPHPTIAPDGVPFCAYEACPQFDGKRCRLVGNEPRGICEPYVRDMVKERDEFAALLSKTIANGQIVESMTCERIAKWLERNGYDYIWNDNSGRGDHEVFAAAIRDSAWREG